MGLSGYWHWIVLGLIVILLFGAPRLPQLARSIAESMKVFRKEIKPEASVAEDEAPEASAKKSAPRAKS